MAEAFIYDHVRTPRGRGKSDGALHEVTALALATAPLKALKERNNLPVDSVDDVILGVVDPIGEAGGDIARFAAMKAGLGTAVPGIQVSRFCASGLDAVNFAAAQVISGQHELTIGGAAYDFAGAAAAMDAQLYGNSGAKSAIDMALHDLVGRASGRPVYALFGTKQRSRIAVLAVIGSEDAAADLRDAQARWNAGYRAFKIKVGLAAPEADALRTMMLCQALKTQARGQTTQGGEPCLVCADANQGFSVDGALTFVRGIGDCGLDFFEQPVSAHDLDGMSRIAAATAVPIGADEGIHSLDDIARHHERAAARGVSLKAIKLGGLSGLFAASRRCAELGMAVNISCKTGETSLASAAAVHLAAVAPVVAWGLTVTSGGLAEDITAAPLAVKDGHVDVPERPGLGIEIDEHRLRCRQQEFKRVA